VLLIGATQPAPPPAPVPGQPEPMRCAATAAAATSLQRDVAARFPARAEGDLFTAYDDVPDRRIWMFTTRAHPAHPSVACIEIVARDGVIGVEVQIGCFSAEANCAALNREFEARGARVRQSLAGH
jgi:hypothetical protein